MIFQIRTSSILKKRTSLLAFALSVTTLSVGLAAMSASDFSRQLKTYTFRPGVFADQLISVGLPSSLGPLASQFWYVRPGTYASAAFGMQNLATFLQSVGIPGLDFSENPLLTSSDMERFLSPSLWSSTPATYRFLYLNLGGTLADDETLPSVGRLYDLQVLQLSNHMSDNGVRWLKDLRRLKVLRMAGAGIHDESLKTVSLFTDLQSLDVGSTAVTDQGLQALAHLPLRQLTLGSGITDQGVQTIAALPTLDQLDLSRSHVTAQGLNALAALPLHTLFLGPSIKDADAATLVHFKNLKRLDLTGAAVTDGVWPTLGAMTSLEELALSQTKISGQTLSGLSALPHLRYLELSDTGVTLKDLRSIRGFSALQVVSFSSTKRVTMGDLDAISRLPKLHSILVNGVLLGPAMVEHLRRRPSAQAPAWNWIENAFAEDPSDAAVEHALQVANLPAEMEVSAMGASPTLQDRSFKGVQGLTRIHEAETSLDDVTPAAATAKVDVFEDNEKNFLGEIVVGVAPTAHH